MALIVHWFWFVYFGKATREKLIDYINSLSSRLPDRDYKILMKGYQDPFFASFQGYPTEEKHPGLYEDAEFRSFIAKSRRIRSYLIWANSILFVLLFAISLMIKA